MAETDIIDETPLTLTEIREHLQTIKQDRDLSFRGNKTLDYTNQFAKQTPTDVNATKERLKALDLLRLKDKHIVKIIDLQPTDVDTVKTILSGENITMKQEELQKILDSLTPQT